MSASEMRESRRARSRVRNDWLGSVDDDSYAGPGHARRVGRIALALAELATRAGSAAEPGELLVAAWSHELGRLAGAAPDPTAVAAEGARLLLEMGCSARVAEGVRHMHERWDGTGGPTGLAGDRLPAVSQLLSVADSLDHYVFASAAAGTAVADAVDRALGLIRVQRGTVFSPEVVDAALRQRTRLQEICVAAEADGGADRRPGLMLVSAPRVAAIAAA